MAIRPSVNAVGAVASSQNAISPAPPAHAVDDILVMVIETANQALAAQGLTNLTNNGWASVANAPIGIGTAGTAGATRLHVYWSRATTAAQTAVNIGDSGDHQLARIIAIKDAIKTGYPFDVEANQRITAATTTLSFPILTTTVANTLILMCHGNDRDVASTTGFPALTNANLTSITEHVDNFISTGTGGGIGAASGGWSGTGAMGNTTGTLASSNVFANWIAAVLPMPDLPAFSFSVVI